MLDFTRLPAGMTPASVVSPGPGHPAVHWPENMYGAYESVDGALVMQCLIVTDTYGIVARLHHGGVHIAKDMREAHRWSILFLPWDYIDVTKRSPTGLAAAHAGDDAPRMWRPLLCRVGDYTGGKLQRYGSQMELEFRWAMHETTQQRAKTKRALTRLARRIGKEHPDEPDGSPVLRDAFIRRSKRITRKKPLPCEMARDRARKLLVEWLSPQQRIDLARDGHFYVAGELNRLYEIQLGNGAAIVDPVTRERRVTVCYHPETWLPDEDVALATKLLIEQGVEGEKILLETGICRPLGSSKEPVPQELQTAFELEQLAA